MLISFIILSILLISLTPEYMFFGEKKVTREFFIGNADACLGETVKVSAAIDQIDLRKGELKLDFQISGVSIPRGFYNDLAANEGIVSEVIGTELDLTSVRADGDKIVYAIDNDGSELTLRPFQFYEAFLNWADSIVGGLASVSADLMGIKVEYSLSAPAFMFL
jgi:hypothetical protein